MRASELFGGGDGVLLGIIVVRLGGEEDVQFEHEEHELAKVASTRHTGTVCSDHIK